MPTTNVRNDIYVYKRFALTADQNFRFQPSIKAAQLAEQNRECKSPPDAKRCKEIAESLENKGSVMATPYEIACAISSPETRVSNYFLDILPFISPKAFLLLRQAADENSLSIPEKGTRFAGKPLPSPQAA